MGGTGIFSCGPDEACIAARCKPALFGAGVDIEGLEEGRSAYCGTLFLDEIGELSMPSQAQLLRVIQDGTYKRVGGNAWQRTEFRLGCATNRDLEEQVRNEVFRGDLYFRIASLVHRVPPLRERTILLPLVRHFIREPCSNEEPPELDPATQD
jgi:transcriptional regulator with GAF, ATPase, and Fis domain